MENNIIDDFGDLPKIRQRLGVNAKHKNAIALLEADSKNLEAFVIYAVQPDETPEARLSIAKKFIRQLAEHPTSTGERYKVHPIPIQVTQLILDQINSSEDLSKKKPVNTENKKNVVSTNKSSMENSTSPDVVFKNIMVHAIQMGASDVHLCVRENSGAVLFRLHGVLRRWARFPSDILTKAIAHAYNTLKLEGTQSHPIFDKNEMQSAMIALKECLGVDINLRWQSTYAVGGFDVVARLLKNAVDNKVLTLEQLGYTPWQQAKLMQASSKSTGGVLIAGVTGSGKTTTLNTLVQLSPNMNLRKTIAIEDPVEYRQRMVTQISVQRKIEGGDKGRENPFSGAMRAILRMDPDNVIFGEIRDQESGSVAQAMIETGHLVFATVHASSCVGIIPRLTSKLIALERDTIASDDFISVLIYQRLVPKNCPYCSIPILDKESGAPKEQIYLLENKFGIDPKNVKVASSKGCEKCRIQGLSTDENDKLGIIGATVAAEMIMPDLSFLGLIRDSKDNEAKLAWRKSRTHRFDEDNMEGKTAYEHALYKVSKGIIDPYYLEDSFESMHGYQMIGTVESGADK